VQDVKHTVSQVAASVAALAVASAAAAAPSSLVQQGKGVFGQYCIACHGANGQGVAPSRTIGGNTALRSPHQQKAYGPSLRGVGALAADFYLRTGYMPLHAIGQQPRRSHVFLTEGQIRALTAYVASLGKGPPIPTPHPERGNLSVGQHLFANHCAGCHQIMAKGGVVTGALPPALEDATDTQIAEAVRIGPYVMPTFSEKDITNAQLDSIIRYVDFTKNPDDRGGWALGDIGPVPEGLVTWFIAGAVLVGLCMIIGKRLHSG
jgi:ubiquinol-cytochrome c reductase cytochrome c subunit